uniref:Ubiquinol-cytochrome-C reductase complex subunit IX, mitochondrial n=1 Tax=Euglena gracilis TaxID=3039 RepID=UCR9_EUGGR|nr:RecName: Full=Ubiquinol-cytochrome-C reductase complex subunit IX, mitochondrial; Flags: Precursor [Euglena gracilis]
MQTHVRRVALQALRPCLRAGLMAPKFPVRFATTAVSGELLTKTPYTRPGYAAQWTCLVVLFLKNQLLMRLFFAFVAYVVAMKVFGARFHVDHDEDATPAE